MLACCPLVFLIPSCAVLPPSSVGEMTLRLYSALSYSQNSACDLRRALNGALSASFAKGCVHITNSKQRKHLDNPSTEAKQAHSFERTSAVYTSLKRLVACRLPALNASMSEHAKKTSPFVLL